jgi:hypothetical protein
MIAGHPHVWGMKAHIGVDAESGLVHTAIGTVAANVVGITPGARASAWRRDRGVWMARRQLMGARGCVQPKALPVRRVLPQAPGTPECISTGIQQTTLSCLIDSFGL